MASAGSVARRGRTVWFLFAGAGLALGVGLLSEAVQHMAAPWLLFPAAQGALLAAGLVAVGRKAAVGRPRWLLPVAAAAALGACAIQHQTAHLRAARTTAGAPDNAARLAFPEHMSRVTPIGLRSFLSRQAAAGRPLPGGLVARGGWAWASWALDGAIAALAAMAGVHLAAREPTAAKNDIAR